jgi:hypothetical protein
LFKTKDLTHYQPIRISCFEYYSAESVEMATDTNSTRFRAYPITTAVGRLFRRRKYIVKRRLQFSLLILALSYALFLTFSVAALLFIPLTFQLNRLAPVSAEASHLADGILFLHGNYWPTVLIPLVIIALHSILTSHKVAGPLYRFSYVFNAVERGNIPKPIRLRKGDYLQDEMEEINRMLAGLRTRIEEIKSLQEEFCMELNVFDRAAGPILPEEQRRLLKSLESKGNRLEEKLADFKIES